MINIEYYEELEREIIDSLWDQDIDMDDWDYLLFIPKKFSKEFRECACHTEKKNERIPEKYNLSRILTGSCRNVWYECTFKGKSGYLGIAYHA